jgi:CBS domain-containing protein
LGWLSANAKEIAMTAVAKRSRLTLKADTAADLMANNPVSIRADAPVEDVVALFATKGFSAAPVIDAAGRPVGVVSRSDVIIHDHALGESGEVRRPRPPEGTSGKVSVRDLMTEAVFAVPADAPATKVVEEMLGLRVHHLFVVDTYGVLVGVISTLDILRHLSV